LKWQLSTWRIKRSLVISCSLEFGDRSFASPFEKGVVRTMFSITPAEGPFGLLCRGDAGIGIQAHIQQPWPNEASGSRSRFNDARPML
jgi:hypothetical protein